MTSDERLLVDLVNHERTSRGLRPLSVDARMMQAARAKAKDIADLGYFDHYSPTYGSPYAMLTAFGVPWQYAGENIARQVRGARDIHYMFMGSPGHRANILYEFYTHLGVGVVVDRYGRTVVAEEFAKLRGY
ncbi:MAG: hypothetical protein HYY08_00760 [Firmicutes bacterium]|nr:hypothetical protein [Bacillota bacterium]